MKPFRWLIIIPCLVIALFSCQPSSRCTDRTDVTINAGFYTIEDSIAIDTTLSNPVIYGIGREDSVLTAGISAVQSIGLPPPPGLTGCAFAFDYGGLSDTITFSYTPEFQLLSFECGFIEIYRDLSVTTTHHIIDSIVVTQALVTYNDEEENIRIYIH